MSAWVWAWAWAEVVQTSAISSGRTRSVRWVIARQTLVLSRATARFFPGCPWDIRVPDTPGPTRRKGAVRVIGRPRRRSQMAAAPQLFSTARSRHAPVRGSSVLDEVRRRVLLVDPDPRSRSILSAHFVRKNFEVTAFSTAEEATRHLMWAAS